MSFDLESASEALLGWLYENSHPNEYTEFAEFLRINNLPDDAAFTLGNDLKNRGLINPVFSLDGSAAAMLTPAGTRHVQQRAQMRQDPLARMTALRDRMVLWLFAAERRGEEPQAWDEFIASDQANFLGDPFAKPEVSQEVEYLRGRGLITTNITVDEEVDGWFYPRLTPDGRDCVTDHGGSVSEYQRSRNTAGSIYTNNITGNSGAVSINSSQVHQSVTNGCTDAGSERRRTGTWSAPAGAHPGHTRTGNGGQPR